MGGELYAFEARRRMMLILRIRLRCMMVFILGRNTNEERNYRIS